MEYFDIDTIKTKPDQWSPFCGGPGLWHLLFSIAWNCRDGALVSYLLRVVLFTFQLFFHVVCAKVTMFRNHALLKHRYGEPKTAEEAFLSSSIFEKTR